MKPAHAMAQAFTISRFGLFAWMAAWVAITLAAMFAVTPYELSLALSFKGSWDSAFGAFIQDWGRKPASVLMVGAILLLTSKTYRSRHPVLARAAAAVCVQFVLHPALLTNIFKLLSGRIRPVFLEDPAVDFTPFYAWTPGLGDFSFPSGHVAIAMILTPCVIVLFRLKRPWAAWGVTLTTAVWAGVMGYGRVLYGAHYLSDVLFSVGAGIALAPLSLVVGNRIVSRLERRQIA